VLLSLLLWLVATAVAAEAQVSASVRPVHSLVAAVMDGVGTPALILKRVASPHDYALRPSELRQLSNTTVLFRVGPQFERFLIRPIAARDGLRDIVWMDLDGVEKRRLRAGGVGSDLAPEDADLDQHIWLDPHNAKVLVKAIVTVLSEVDPTHAIRYQANGQQLQERLAQLDSELRHQLAGLGPVPFVVYHDACQYFETRYGLNRVATISAHDEQLPGARRVLAIRQQMLDENVACVFSGARSEPALVRALVAGTRATTGVLDPLGWEFTPGPELYFELMHGLAEAFQQCLVPHTGAADKQVNGND